MFLFPFIAAAAGLPLLGGQFMAAQKYKSIQKVAEAAASQLDITLLVVRFFLIFILVLLTVWLIIKLKTVWGGWKVKRIGELLFRLETEIKLQEDVEAFSKHEKEALSASAQETIQMLIERLTRRNYFAKRLGAEHCKMMVETLTLMRDGKIDAKEQLSLIAHWLKIVHAFQNS
jgi:hypothetical protein